MNPTVKLATLLLMLLATGALAAENDSEARRGRPNPFFPADTGPAKFYVRAMVRHSFSTSGVLSRYNFDCCMIPRPASSVIFRIGGGAKVSRAFSNEVDPEGVQGPAEGKKGGEQLYVFPVKPTRIKRGYYRCKILLIIQSTYKLPTEWAVPPVFCTGATPKVFSESGYIALATLGGLVEIIPTSRSSTYTLLNAVHETMWPKQFAGRFTKAVYHYPKPAYRLTAKVQRRHVEVAVKPSQKPTPPPKVKPTPPPKVKPTPPPQITPTPPEPEPKLVIPPPPGAGPPLKLTAIVVLEEPEAQRQVVLRHKDTGRLYRKREGDTILGDLRVARISDNSVLLVGPGNQRYVLHGRFEGLYGE